MKKTLLYIGAVVIFILAAVAFVFVPAKAGGVSNGAYPVFGKYDGKPIELKPGTDFANAVNNYSNYYRNQGINIDDSGLFYVYNFAFNAAVVNIAAKDAVNKTGYSPSKKTISRNLVPYFTDETGKYSQRLYNSISDEQRADLRKGIVSDLISRRFQEDNFGSSEVFNGKHFYGLKELDSEIAFLEKMGSAKRAFDIVSFDKSKYPESEIKAFANSNSELFDKYDLSAITISDEPTAKKVQKQLVNGEIKFEDTVNEEYSEKNFTDNSGKITSTYQYQYQIKNILSDSASFATIQSLAKDSYSDIIKTTKGFTIFRKDGDSKKSDFEDKNALDVVKRYVTSNEAGKVEDYFIKQAKDFTTNAMSSGFENVSVEEIDGAEKFTSSAFPLNYGGATIAAKLPSDITPLAAASTNENFWEKAFSLKLGEYSEPIVVGNYVVVLKFANEENETSEQSKLDSIKSDVVSYDESASQSVILNSDKVENNVSQAYFKYFVNNK